MRQLIYFFREAVRGFYQAKLMTAVSIFTIAVALFLLGVLGIAYLNIKFWLTSISGGVEVVAYVADKTSADAPALDALIDSVKRMPSVEQVTLIDKAAAWKRFEGLYGANMLEAVDNNPFPASLEINLMESNQSATSALAVKTALERMKGVEGVSYSREWLSRIEAIRNYFLLGTFIAGLGLILALHFLISNSIKLTIYARKELITNMYFVGATGLYIKMPFILEGMLQGMIGGFLGVACIAALRVLLAKAPVFWGSWNSYLFLIPVGVIFGWIGSVGAVRKFLR